MRHISNDKKMKKNFYRVEETTGSTSISGEGAFFATSDDSDDVVTGEEVEETESEFCTETCVLEGGR
jgi:hypothetical protein